MPDVPTADSEPTVTSGTAQLANRETWEEYGRDHLRRGTTYPVPDRINWGMNSGEETGPGTDALGPLNGRMVLELGSGTGRFAAHLARDHGAIVTALDSSISQYQRAAADFGDTDGLTLVHGDVFDHLSRHASAWDVVYSVNGALCFTDPRWLLPAIAKALRPGGRLVFSTLHTNYLGEPPSRTVAPSPQRLVMKDKEPQRVYRWVLAPDVWRGLLEEHGFEVESIEEIAEQGSKVSSRLIRATRRPAATRGTGDSDADH